ncbi:MAG TPA: chorismate synthase, partial [Candidatus Acidoferrum sp.]|nr:chorismate synthase [Candidatus Acidoferrum sp.]
MLRYLTAGESHGQALVAILEGMPSNVPVTAGDINVDLRRRMGGYGRGGRMKIEQDEVEILGGVRHGKSLRSPICLMVRNRDWE